MTTKNCTNCNAQYTVTDDDLAFYKKLNLPDPTHCPVCRVQRRMAWRNDRTFYQRKCDKSGTIFVSLYPQDVPFPVYKPSEWYSDSWNAMDYGREFDFSRPFFEQWHELMMKVPRLGIDIVGCENSDYCNYCGYDRNCYLDIAGENNEDSYFNLFVKYSKNCADCTFVYHSELCYQSINCHNCYNIKYSMYLENCNDCNFCFDLKGCKNCLFSSNLRQKQYYIFNKPHTKEEYEAKVDQLNLGSQIKLQGYIQNWKDVMKKAIHRDMYITNGENCIGNNIKNSRNCKNVFNTSDSEDSKYLFDVLNAKDCMDLNYSLYNPEVSCELISTLDLKYSAFNMASHHSSGIFYCDMCNNSSNLFGCIGLNHAKYCILNKQYSKVEYEKLVPKIIEYMGVTVQQSKKNDFSASKTQEAYKNKWGEFFPIELSPHPYNTTVAQEYHPLTKKQALAKGYGWKEKDQTEYRQASCEIPDDIKDTGDNIVDETLACEDCGKNYRIIAQELRYYKKQILPIPRKCPDCRHLDRMRLRTPRQLWQSQCGKCGKNIHTSYSPNRSEMIYCEPCYKRAIY